MLKEIGLLVLTCSVTVLPYCYIEAKYLNSKTIIH